MFCKSFQPLIHQNCTILILGSMPGVKSLSDQQYYAHPLNRFWKLMAIILQEEIDFTNYDNKTSMLLRHNIALWDTLAYCEREGSLDSNIKAEHPNDILTLLQSHPKITKIICNGGKASNAFKKYFAKELPSEIKVFYLPSTSPANARSCMNDLKIEWLKAIEA